MEDGASFLLVDDQLSVLHVVAKRRQAAHPHALLLGSGDLVADAFAGHFPLELGKGEQHVQGKPPHARGGVELLGDRDEGDAPSVEGFHDLGEVEQRTRQSVDLIDHHDVNLGLREYRPRSRCRAGRSIVPPEKPPSSYKVGKTVQPSCFWERMKAAQASRWASSELNACSRPSSDDLRV